jgi:hypothetical protein
LTHLLAAAGLVAAIAGWFVTGLVTPWIAGLAGMSDFEGARAMFARPWQRATHADVPGTEHPAAAATDDPFERRWRVRRAGEE